MKPISQQIDSAGPRALRCPYPGCAGSVAGAAHADELVVCPHCQRLAARCPRIGKDGQCRALNRPLARFCRHCRNPFAPGWAQAAWALDTRGSRPGAGGLPGGSPPETSLVLDDSPPVTVLDLGEWLPPNPRLVRPLELAEAAGRLWIGARDGRYLFVEPFSDRQAEPTVIREQLWAGVPSLRFRTRVDGTWMVLFSRNGIKAINLLALDDPQRDDYRPIDLWEASAESRLVSDPLLLRGLPDGEDELASLERHVVWLTSEPRGGLRLWSATLSLSAWGAPERRAWNLTGPGAAGLPLEGQEQRAVLLAAPFGRRECALLGTRKGLWLLDVPLGPTPDKPRLVPLFGGSLVTHAEEDMPGIVFMPGEMVGPDEPAGRVFFAQEDSQAGGRVLYAGSVSLAGMAAPEPYRGYGGIPLDVVDKIDTQGVLCLQQRTLTLCNWLHHQIPMGTSGYLDNTTRADVNGVVAICSGMSLEGGQGHWFATLMDLEKRRIIASLVWLSAASHPVLLGRYLFTLEEVPGENKNTSPLQLVRRELRLQRKTETGREGEETPN